MASEGALKLPDLGAGTDDQLALEGFFAPTGVVQGGVLTSVDPRPLDPQVAVVVYQGYLGLDSGIPQSVYSLDPTQIDRGRLSEVAAANLAVGESVELPDGTTVAFTGYPRVRRAAVLARPRPALGARRGDRLLLGLLGMLLVRRERVFARVAAGRAAAVPCWRRLAARGSGEAGPGSPRCPTTWAPCWPTAPTRPHPHVRRRRFPGVTPDSRWPTLSDTFFAVSVAVYSVALVAFCAQLAFGRRPPRVGARGAPGRRPRRTEPSGAGRPGHPRHPLGRDRRSG